MPEHVPSLEKGLFYCVSDLLYFYDAFSSLFRRAGGVGKVCTENSWDTDLPQQYREAGKLKSSSSNSTKQQRQNAGRILLRDAVFMEDMPRYMCSSKSLPATNILSKFDASSYGVTYKAPMPQRGFGLKGVFFYLPDKRPAYPTAGQLEWKTGKKQ
jgi:hypothetical protein